jgi:cbb3-type cytochrome oxidase maturation protein
MSVIYVLLPVATLLAVAAVAGFIWAVRRGQLDDLDTPPIRVAYDEEDEDRRRGSARP